jgi:steroid delta-isomerase-like uncharacterized protein
VTESPPFFSRLVTEAFNQGNLASIEELLAIDSITHLPAWGMPGNRTGLKQLIASFRLAFPDLHCTIEDEIGEGNKFAALWTLRGTNKGPFLGNQPTGRKIVAKGITFARTENGRIIENWILIDQMGMLQQLGIIPPPRDVQVQKEPSNRTPTQGD